MKAGAKTDRQFRRADSAAAESLDDSRRVRHGRGRPFPFVSLSTALQKALNSPVMKRRMNSIPIAEQWAQLVDPETAEHIFPVSLEKGVLVLEADSSAWRHQMSLKTAELLPKLAARFGATTVKEIRVR